MVRITIILLIMGIGFLNAGDVQNIQKLQAEKKALELKLEAYALKKKIIEMEQFFEKTRVEKEERLERERALVQLKNDLRANRTKRKVYNKQYKG